MKVPLDAPLLLPLVQPYNVIPDIPVFYVMAKGTEFYDKMRTGNGGSFLTLAMPKLPPRPDEE